MGLAKNTWRGAKGGDDGPELQALTGAPPVAGQGNTSVNELALKTLELQVGMLHYTAQDPLYEVSSVVSQISSLLETVKADNNVVDFLSGAQQVFLKAVQDSYDLNHSNPQALAKQVRMEARALDI